MMGELRKYLLVNIELLRCATHIAEVVHVPSVKSAADKQSSNDSVNLLAISRGTLDKANAPVAISIGTSHFLDRNWLQDVVHGTIPDLASSQELKS